MKAPKKTNPLTSRRGVAIEFALIVLVVVFGLSTIITSTTILQAAQRNRIKTDFEEQIGSKSAIVSFSKFINNDQDPTTNVNNWNESSDNFGTTAVFEGTTYILTIPNVGVVSFDSNGKVIN